MVQPFFDDYGAGSYPSGVDARYSESCSAVRMAMSVTNVCSNSMRSLWIKVAVETYGTLPTHIAATHKEQATHAQASQALNLAKSKRETISRGLDTPGDGSKSKHVRGQVGHAVPGVGDHGL